MNRKILSIIIIILLLLSACNTKNSDSSTTELLSSTPDASFTLAPSNTVVPIKTYTIGTVVAVEDKYAYIKTEMVNNTMNVGSAALGAKLEVIKETSNWSQVIYDGEKGFIETKYLSIAQEKAEPIHTPCYLPKTGSEIGLVQHKFNNLFTIKMNNGKMDVYTTNNVLIATDVAIVISDGKVIGPAINIATATPTIEPTSTPTTEPTQEPGPTVETTPGEGETPTVEATIEITPAPTQAPTAIPTQVPVSVRVEVESGSIKKEQGIKLSKGLNKLSYNAYRGMIISEKLDIIDVDKQFLDKATIKINYGKIYTKNMIIEIEKSYYLVPKLLKNNLVDVAYLTDDISIKMKFATEENPLGENVYGRSVCLLQSDTLEKLLKAVEVFKEDGYTLIIYDAYRPYSVTVKLYNKYKNTSYVAGTRFGSYHNKGVAIDMSLLDGEGNPIEMPSDVMTLNSTSNRNNKDMTKTARKNMEYMEDVMKDCGFSTISSEWWHFTDTNCMQYLRTDYDLENMLKVIY